VWWSYQEVCGYEAPTLFRHGHNIRYKEEGERRTMDDTTNLQVWRPFILEIYTHFYVSSTWADRSDERSTSLVHTSKVKFLHILNLERFDAFLGVNVEFKTWQSCSTCSHPLMRRFCFSGQVNALAMLSPHGLRRLALVAFVRIGLRRDIVFNYCFDLYQA
jgi:hypothetical protein